MIDQYVSDWLITWAVSQRISDGCDDNLVVTKFKQKPGQREAAQVFADSVGGALFAFDMDTVAIDRHRADEAYRKAVDNWRRRIER